MKQVLIVALSFALLSGVCLAGDKLDMADEKVRLSYSVGYQVGGDFLRQGTDINPELLLKGVQDALLGKEPLMTPQEMRTTLVDLQKKVAAVQDQKSKVDVDKNLAEGKTFLAENRKKEGVKTLPSGLQYRNRLEIWNPSLTERAFASKIAKNMFSYTVPTGKLQPGRTYIWRVLVFDSISWDTYQNRSSGEWQTITMAKKPE